MKWLVLFSLTALAVIGGEIPGLRGYYPKHMLPQSPYKGLEFIENTQDIECPESVFETFANGSCHNIRYPVFGVSGNVLLRFGEAVFTDGRSEVDEEKVSARIVSNSIFDQPPNVGTNQKQMSQMLIFMGQFIDHDCALTPEQESESNGEILSIEIPPNDERFNIREFEFFRSESIVVDTVRQFATLLSPFLDLGTVYGETQEKSDMLRAFVNGSMNVTIIDGEEYPPLLENGMFFCGDIRCEENPMLFALHVLWLREHNRIARAYQANVTNATDEEVFQFARLLNINQYQSVVYDFYLPYLLGRRTLLDLAGKYNGFIEGTDPQVSVAFISAAYRYGHSGIPDDLAFLDIDGNQVRPILALAESFLSGAVVTEDPGNLAAIILGQSLREHEILDTFITDALRNNLFANMPENINAESGLDLVARNIQRCRDHGCPSLNNYRFLFGLDVYECPEDDQLDCFRQLTGELDISQRLYDLYEEFEECDLFACGMAEKTFEDSQLGETFTVIIADQFRRFRDGDRIWWELIYEEAFDPDFLASINVQFPTTLTDVIINNLATPENEVSELGSAFLISNPYLAWVTADTIQVEWTHPDVLRNNVDQYDVEIQFPNGSTRNLIVEEPEMQYILVQDLDPNGEHTFTVEGVRTDNGARVVVGPALSVMTLEAEEQPGDGLIGGLEPEVVGGIIGGVVGGVLLIGGAVFCIKRRNRFKNDDINAQFF